MEPTSNYLAGCIGGSQCLLKARFKVSKYYCRQELRLKLPEVGEERGVRCQGFTLH